MCLLKNKIANVRKLHALNEAQKRDLLSVECSDNDSTLTFVVIKSVKIDSKKNQASEKITSAKKYNKEKEVSCPNIIKNYSKAIIHFVLSSSCLPYLDLELCKEGLSLEEFRSFVREQKNKINCIKNLRSVLIIELTDSEKIAASKRVFQSISEVFLKYFSVNWLFNSKVDNKITHLNARFRILRRIRNPESFTYLEGFYH